MRKIYAIIPCYNEEKNIGKLIEEWNNQNEELAKNNYELEIVAIYDCSSDNTYDIILNKKKKFDNVKIIKHSNNLGLQGGLNTALNYFYNNGKSGDLFAFMNGNNTPKYVHEMIKCIYLGNDCVIASRYQNNSKVVGLSKKRKIMSNLARVYYSIMLNIKNVRDYTCEYRLYTYDIIKKLIEKFGNNPIKEKSFACMMELLYKLYLVDARFSEVGFELRYDYKIGESKMKFDNTAIRSIFTAMSLKLKYDFTSLFIYLFIIILAIALSIATNYSPISNYLNHDSGIFGYVGWAMHKGKILYTEVWENKGPLLYVIYYIGLFINARYGVYFFELISIFITIFCSYKIIYMITNSKLYSILGTFYSFSVYGITFDGGTLSENFALPLIVLGIYIFTKYIFSDEKIKNIEIIIFGILTGFIFLLRLNMLSIFSGIFLTIGINMLLNKKYKEIFKWMKFGIIGFIISTVPIAIYLISNNALLDCINSAYTQILSGFNAGSIWDRIKALSVMFEYFNISGGTIVLFAFIFVGTFIIVKCKSIVSNKYILYILATILSTIINIYSNSLSGAVHIHYFLTFIPIMIMIIAIIIKGYDQIKIKEKIKKSILASFIIVFSIPGYRYYVQECYMKEQHNHYTNDSYFKIAQYIIQNTDEEDKVQFMGGSNEAVTANYRTKRLAGSKYSYLPLWQHFTIERKNKIVNECIAEVKFSMPKLIFVCNKNEDEFFSLINDKDDWNLFLNENYAVDLVSIEDYKIYYKVENN